MLPDLFRLIGSDRYLSAREVEQSSEPHPLSAAAWDVYASHFHGFTGAVIDPLFHALSHPSTRRGAVRLDPGTSVLVVGAGPSLKANLDGLKVLEGRVRIFTSPRGAEVLLPHGIVPDLVLVEHQTALDAHHSARHAGDSGEAFLRACPLIAADWRTPAAMLAGVALDSLFVPSPLPTWGLWPATAVAMAMESGAERVCLLGIDLGSADAPDPAHAPLAAVLSLLARLSTAVTIDCGPGGAPKRNWLHGTLADAAGTAQHGRCPVDLHDAPGPDTRVEQGRAALAELAPIIARAHALLAVADGGRNGSARVPALEEAVTEMLSWREDARVRVLLQETLGLAFVPRLWRTRIDLSLGPALWRPLMLGTHELVRQADALGSRLGVPAAAAVFASQRVA